MNTDEFKKRLIRGFIRSPYFYIPVKEETPTDTLIHYVIAKVQNPLTSKIQRFEREKWTYNVGNHNNTGPAQQIFDTPQGRLYIQDEHDPAYSAGTTIREWYLYERADEIYVCKIYNKSTYLGYFVPVTINIGSWDTEGTYGPITNLVPEDNTRIYLASPNCRWDNLGTNMGSRETFYSLDSHADVLFFNNRQRYPTLVDLSLYGIEGSRNEFGVSEYLDENFQPCSISDARYDVHPPEGGVNISRTVLTATSGYRNNWSYITMRGTETRQEWQSATANGIDLSRGSASSWQADVQANIPAVERTIINSDIGMGSFSMYNSYSETSYVALYPIYNDLNVDYYYEDPTDYWSLKIRWSGGDIPIADDRSSVMTTYLGDGLNKATCAQYQTIFATGDYASVGATGMVIEIEE